MSIYEDVVRAGGFIDHHGPDLRIEITEANDRILQKYPLQDAMKEICLVPATGKLYWHIPFAFDPLVARPGRGFPANRPGSPFAWAGSPVRGAESGL